MLTDTFEAPGSNCSDKSAVVLLSFEKKAFIKQDWPLRLSIHHRKGLTGLHAIVGMTLHLCDTDSHTIVRLFADDNGRACQGGISNRSDNNLPLLHCTRPDDVQAHAWTIKSQICLV